MSDVLVSVDPGLRGCGVAVFADGVLLSAQYVANPAKGDGPKAWLQMGLQVFRAVGAFVKAGFRMVVEVPRVYPVSKGDPNDLIQIAGVAGAVVGQLTPDTAQFTYPSDWKGQVPKEICQRRITALLSKTELDSVQSVGYKDHNTYDAIGIGLVALRRAKQGIT